MAAPLWQNHDEPEHFAYTYYLAEEKKIPVYQGVFDNHFDQSLSAEMDKALKLLESSVMSSSTFRKHQVLHQDFSNGPTYEEITSQLNTLSRKNTDPNFKNAAVIYSPLYYGLEAIPYLIFYKSDIIARSYAMRLFGIIFLLITVFFAYKAALLLLKNKMAALTVAILIGFLPRFSYTAGGINNDNLLITLTTILIYLLIKYLPEQLKTGNIIWLGLTFGLGLLSKPQFIVFTPLIIGFFVYKLIKSENKKNIVLYAVIFLSVVLLIAGWWFLFNYYHYGNFLTKQYVGAGNNYWPRFQLILSFFVLRYFYLFYSYFLTFGCCSEVSMGEIYQFIFSLSVGLFFLGLFVSLFKLKIKNLVLNNTTFIRVMTLIISIFLLEGFLMYLFLKNIITQGTIGFPIDGRYLYPVIAPLTIIFLMSLQKIIPKKIHSGLYIILSLGIIFINVVSLIYYIIPRYYL